MIKNIYYIFVVPLLCIACQQEMDNKSHAKTPTKIEPKVDTVSKIRKTTEEMEVNAVENEENQEKKEAFKLNTDNAVAFLKSYGQKNKESKAVIHTDFGDIYLRLSNKTPLHRAAFVYLVKNHYYDNTLFYRVSPNFVIQGGNTNDLSAMRKKNEIGYFELPQEFDPTLYHKIGALAACKDYEGNPKNLSNPYNFYIIAGGRKFSDKQLAQLPGTYNVDFSPASLMTYKNEGGQPSLDQKHTVYGVVYKGMNVVRKINAVETDVSEWPRKNIKMTIELLP